MKLGPSKHDLHRTTCILLVSLFVFMLSGFFLPEHVAHAQDKDFEYILTDGEATSFTHPALNANTVYSYKVRACFDAGVRHIFSKCGHTVPSIKRKFTAISRL